MRLRGKGVKKLEPAMFAQVETHQRDYCTEQHHGSAVTAGHGSEGVARCSKAHAGRRGSYASRSPQIPKSL
jgi:hypothetical protein